MILIGHYATVRFADGTSGGMSGRNGIRQLARIAALAGYCAATAAGISAASAQDSGPKPSFPGMAPGQPVVVETLYFNNAQPAVRVVRGLGALPSSVSRSSLSSSHALPSPAPSRLEPVTAPPLQAGPAPPRHTEIVTFGSGRADQVTIVRGGGSGLPLSLASRNDLPERTTVEKVNFGDTGGRMVTVAVIRGLTSPKRDLFDVDLFASADIGELDRVAFAVDWLESRHGADLRMWRPSPTGPQGPMQVSAAAALDVGGGNRFDITENRQIGRAYLAAMFRRYGNWADALGAYNWGPGAMDQWIAGGRQREKMPDGVASYINRGLREAFLPKAARL